MSDIDLTGDDAPQQPPMSVPPPAGQMPTPAELPSGVNATNPDGTAAQLPLPTGQAVMDVDVSKMTSAEREGLEKAGWKPGQPIPANMADAIAAVEAQAHQDAAGDRPPVDPGTPPLSYDPVDIATLPDAERAKYEARLQEELARGAAAAPPVPTRPLSEVAKKVAAARVIPPTPKDQPAPTPEAVNPFDDSPAQPAADATGTGTPFTECPHCAWDLAVPALAEPEYAEKMTFLHTVMNGQQFTKEYSLMAGNLLIGFRTLTTREMDMVYQHVYFERERNIVHNDAELWERINRFRMYLQITHVRTSERSRDMPDGLSREANPNAKHFWKLPEVGDKGPLAALEDYMFKEIVPTESLIRLAQFNCQQFNRLVSKLEALTDNSDFWTKTEEQP